MAGILDLLDELEEQEEQKKPAKQRNKKLPSSYVSAGARKTRPTSRPPPLDEQRLRPPVTNAPSERSPSIGPDSARRISFAEVPRPEARRLWIPTKTDSLASGFIYDPRLNKYSVSEEEWKQFNKEITEAADVKSPSWMWAMQRKNVIKKVTKDLQYVESSYDGDVKRVLKKFNHFWKNQKGFTVWLELPTLKGQVDLSDDVGDTAEDRERAKRNAKRFRVVISSVDKEGRAASVYSRTSSISKSIRGEGAGVLHDDMESPTDADDEPEENTLEVPPVEADDLASPQSDYHDAVSHVDPEEKKSPLLHVEEPSKD